MQWLMTGAALFAIAWIVADKSPAARSEAQAWATKTGLQLWTLIGAYALIYYACSWIPDP